MKGRKKPTPTYGYQARDGLYYNGYCGSPDWTDWAFNNQEKNMKLTIEVCGETVDAMGAEICRIGSALLGTTPRPPAEEVKPAAAPKAPKKKVEEKVEEAEEEIDLGEAENEVVKITLPEVIEKLKDYATTHTREKAAKVLAKFKVKSVRDLKPEQFAQVLEALE